jgi:hypothetical protein
MHHSRACDKLSRLTGRRSRPRGLARKELPADDTTAEKPRVWITARTAGTVLLGATFVVMFLPQAFGANIHGVTTTAMLAALYVTLVPVFT